ncbi:MAG: hypothetical protein RKE49_08965 [Oceanicaulis sp.]
MTADDTGRSPLPPLSAVLATGALAGLMVVEEPGSAPLWVLAGVMLPTAWLILETVAFAGDLSIKRREARDRVRLAITIASVMLALPLALTLLFTSGMVTASDAVEQRALGAAFGLGLVIYGNWSTKAPVELDAPDAARQQARARVFAAAFVLAGLGCALAWLAAPISLAPWIAGAVLALPAAAVAFKAFSAKA